LPALLGFQFGRDAEQALAANLPPFVKPVF
jgi:hypothetical protein